MLISWVERDGLARSVLVLLAITTIGSFSYSWGYYEGFYNAKVLGQLEKDHVANVHAPTTTLTPDTGRKVQHSIPTGELAQQVSSVPDAETIRTARDKVSLPKNKRQNAERERRWGHNADSGRQDRHERVHVRSQDVHGDTGSNTNTGKDAQKGESLGDVVLTPGNVANQTRGGKN